MSINNLFYPNGYDLYCNSIFPNNLISNKSIYRFNLDPSSNPDPLIGGLIVNSLSTHLYDFKIPLTLQNQSLDFANPIHYDPLNHFSLSNNVITCHKDGYYNISFQFSALSNLLTPNNVCIFQILKDGVNMFSGPPALSSANNFCNFASLPFSALFNIGSFSSSSANVHLVNGDTLTLKFYLAFDSCVIPLTQCISITEL